MSKYEISVLFGLIVIVLFLAKQLQASQRMHENISELRNVFERQTVYLNYLVKYAHLESDLSERGKSVFDLHMGIDLQCIGLDGIQAANLREEMIKDWKEFNELMDKDFFTKDE